MSQESTPTPDSTTPDGARGPESAPTPEATPSQPELGWAPSTDRGFWTRFKEVLAGGPASSEPATEATSGEAEASAPEPLPVTTPKPRKVRRTPFDKARAAKKDAESRRTRLRRVADEKREGLALVVGESVEKVLVEKLETRDEENMTRVSQGFVELSGVLGGLGRTLTSQEEHARVLEEALRHLPEAEREQARAFAGLARAIGEHAGTTDRVAHSLEGVPEIVSLVKQGSGMAQGQLLTLREVQRELELQRDQRERVVEGVHKVERALVVLGEQVQSFAARQAAAQDEANAAAARFERALQVVGQRIAVATDADDARHQEVRAREQESVARLERAMGAVTARLDLQAREEADRSHADRECALDHADRLERGIAVMAARVHEQSTAILGSQAEAAAAICRSQESVVEAFADAQSSLVAELERRHVETAREQARGRRRASLATGVLALASFAAVGFFGSTFVQAERDRADAELAAERSRTQAAVGVARARAEALFALETAPAPAAVATTAELTSASVASASSSSYTTLPAGFGR